MLLYNDSRHLFRWGGLTCGLALVAIGLRVWFEPDGPETLPSGSRVGLWYGIIGGAIILFAWLLSALRFVPSWWFIGSRALWLKGHIWLGMLSFVLILCHSGMRFGGTFEQILYLVFALVLATGVLGVILQQFVPRLMTVEVPCEVPYEQIPNVCGALREKADRDLDEKCVAPAEASCARIKQWYEEVVRPFLAWPMRNHLLSDANKAQQLFAEMRALPSVEHAASQV